MKDEALARALQLELNTRDQARTRRELRTVRERKPPQFFSPQVQQGYGGFHNVEFAHVSSDDEEGDDESDDESQGGAHQTRQLLAGGTSSDPLPSKRPQRSIRQPDYSGSSGGTLEADSEGKGKPLGGKRTTSAVHSGGQCDSDAGRGSGAQLASEGDPYDISTALATLPTAGKPPKAPCGVQPDTDGAVPDAIAADGKAAASKKYRRIPKLPMILVDHKWYRARTIRETEHKICIQLPGFDGRKPDWLERSDPRIWNGSYKGKDWRYLGDGAWAPRPKSKGRKKPQKLSCGFKSKSGKDSSKGRDAGTDMEEDDDDDEEQGVEEEHSGPAGASDCDCDGDGDGDTLFPGEADMAAKEARDGRARQEALDKEEAQDYEPTKGREGAKGDTERTGASGEDEVAAVESTAANSVASAPADEVIEEPKEDNDTGPGSSAAAGCAVPVDDSGTQAGVPHAEDLVDGATSPDPSTRAGSGSAAMTSAKRTADEDTDNSAAANIPEVSVEPTSESRDPPPDAGPQSGDIAQDSPAQAIAQAEPEQQAEAIGSPVAVQCADTPDRELEEAATPDGDGIQPAAGGSGNRDSDKSSGMKRKSPPIAQPDLSGQERTAEEDPGPSSVVKQETDSPQPQEGSPPQGLMKKAKGPDCVEEAPAEDKPSVEEAPAEYKPRPPSVPSIKPPSPAAEDFTHKAGGTPAAAEDTKPEGPKVVWKKSQKTTVSSESPAAADKAPPKKMSATPPKDPSPAEKPPPKKTSRPSQAKTAGRNTKANGTGKSGGIGRSGGVQKDGKGLGAGARGKAGSRQKQPHSPVRSGRPVLVGQADRRPPPTASAGLLDALGTESVSLSQPCAWAQYRNTAGLSGVKLGADTPGGRAAVAGKPGGQQQAPSLFGKMMTPAKDASQRRQQQWVQLPKTIWHCSHPKPPLPLFLYSSGPTQ